MKLILRYLRRELPLFLLAVFFLLLECLSELVQPAWTARIVDLGVYGSDRSLILRTGSIMLGIAVLGVISAVLRNLFSAVVSNRVSCALREDLYAKILTLSRENSGRLTTASLITRLTNDVNQIQVFVNGCMRILIRVPFTCIGALILLLRVAPQESSTVLLVLVLSAVLVALNLKTGYPRFGRMQEALDLLNRRSREFLSSVRVVRAFGAEEEEARKFDEASDHLRKTSTDAMEIMAVFTPLTQFAVNFGILLILWHMRVPDAGRTGHLLASVNYMTQMGNALSRASKILNTIMRASASAERIGEVFQEEPAVRFPENGVSLRPAGDVAFDHVSFTYPGGRSPALTGLTFSVSAGETVGIIGPTGAGKSTLLSLLLRDYDVTEGAVRLGGTDIREFGEKELTAAIACVPQKAVLFTGSIRDNLRMGKADATDEELRAVLGEAAAEELLTCTEDGLDTRLGQGGVNLSGGQKQRLTLARALLKKPVLLLLDDVTSALDADTESRIRRQLLEKGAQSAPARTTFLVSQKVSSVMGADRILCLGDGRLLGEGTHAELMKNCPAYREICRSQMGGEDA